MKDQLKVGTRFELTRARFDHMGREKVECEVVDVGDDGIVARIDDKTIEYVYAECLETLPVRIVWQAP